MRQQNPDSDVELSLVNEEWSLNVLLNDESVELDSVRLLFHGWQRGRGFTAALSLIVSRGGRWRV